MVADLAAYLECMSEIPGWFYPEDAALFGLLDNLTRERGTTGDLLEIGAYVGRSSILLGHMLSGDEELTVCDPFENDVSDAENRRENQRWYADLARRRFEEMYLRHHTTLPRIRQCPSSELSAGDFVRPLRFIHIDGSHLYDAVRRDIDLALSVVAGGGIIAIDDYRSVHTPGAAAAAWEMVAKGAAHITCLSENKMYISPAVLGDAERARLAAGAIAQGLFAGETTLHGKPVLMCGDPTRVRHLDPVSAGE